MAKLKAFVMATARAPVPNSALQSTKTRVFSECLHFEDGSSPAPCIS